MKKLYSLALGLLATLGLSAQVTIGETNYETLQAALDAANDGDVITINEDITIDKRVDKNKKNLTIQGANPDVKVIRKWGWNSIMFLGNAGNADNDNDTGITIKNLTIDSNGVDTNTSVVESNAGKLTLSNVTIINVNQTKGYILTQKGGGGGWMVLENVNIVEPVKADGVYDFFTGNPNALTLKGSGDYVGYLQSTYSLKADGYTGHTTAYIETYSPGRTVAVGGSVANFSLGNAPEGYSLTENNGNVVLLFEKNVVYNETTGEYYSNPVTAFTTATSGNILTVLEDIDMPDRVGLKASITIQGATPSVTLRNTNTSGNSNQFAFETNTGITLTLKDVILDVNHYCKNSNVFNIKGSLSLDNVTIKNADKAANLIQLSSSDRKLSMNNAIVEDSGDVTFAVLSNNNGNPSENITILYNGNCNIGVSLSKGCSIEVPADGQLTNEEPIELIPSDKYEYVDNFALVKNCSDFSKFDLKSTSYHLEANDGNLVLVSGDLSGISAVVADENAPVEYYNLQGIRVENPSNGIFIRRQGTKTTKVAL